MCMSKPYMFLSYLIPGPSNPKASIDVYLEPLIDDLKKLWVGILTYDVSRKQNFMMRACLMWTLLMTLLLMGCYLVGANIVD